jgi:hypothetical protein
MEHSKKKENNSNTPKGVTPQKGINFSYIQGRPHYFKDKDGIGFTLTRRCLLILGIKIPLFSKIVVEG